MCSLHLIIPEAKKQMSLERREAPESSVTLFIATEWLLATVQAKSCKLNQKLKLDSSRGPNGLGRCYPKRDWLLLDLWIKSLFALLL